MSRRFGLFAGILVVLIVAGGVAVAFVNSSSSQVSYVAAPGATSDTVPILGGLTNLANLNANVASTSTATMTVTSVATYTSAQTLSSTTAVTPQNTPQGRGSQGGAPGQVATSGRSIEFFSNVTLRVSTPSLAVDKASAVAYSLGGYVAYSFFTNSTALVVVRVPADNYQRALSQIESLGTVVGAVTNSNDVTVRYNDLNATLISLKGEQASLLKLLNESVNINATLRIYSMVQQVNAQINEVQSEILQTRTLIDYATISVSLEKIFTAPVPKPLALKFTETPKSGFSPLSVTFNAIVSGGVSPYIVNYNFGDGTSSRAQVLLHTFDQPGHYNISVTATDSTGNVTESSTTINVLNPPVTSSFGTFPAFVGGLFLGVIEGIIEVAVVVLPIVAVIGVVVIPLKHRFDVSKKRIGTAAASANSPST